MSEPINQDSIIGKFLPNVFVERITIESSGHPTYHKKDPHVEWSGDLLRFKQENQQIETTEMFASALQRGRRAGARGGRQNAAESAGKLTVKLELSIREKVENTDNLIMNWLQDIDFQKYVKILVVQSTHPTVTKLLCFNDTALTALQPDSAVVGDVLVEALSDPFVRSKIPELDGIAPAPPGPGNRRQRGIYNEAIQSIRSQINDNTEWRKLELTDTPAANRDVVESSFRGVVTGRSSAERISTASPENFIEDMDGNRYKDIPFSLTFKVDKIEPEHLAYLVAATFDVQAIINDYDLDPTDAPHMNGKVHLDVVVDNGRTVSEAFLNYDKYGKVWAGKTYRTETGVLMSGWPGASNSMPLTKRRVANSKIQDFRNFDRLKRYSIDTTPATSILNSSLMTDEMKKFNRHAPPMKEMSYFSPLSLTKDESENVHFFFSIDAGKILRQKTRYGHLFSEEMLGAALDRIKIISMKVFRRRVKKQDALNRLGMSVESEIVFDNNEPPALLAATGELRPGQLAEVGNFREINIHVPAPGFDAVRHFTGTDATMKGLTTGHYRYEVEMEILDDTAKFFQDRVTNLVRARNNFKEWNNLCQRLENYDPASNKFKKGFRDSPPEEFIGGGRFPGKVGRALATYIESYNYLRKEGAANMLTTSGNRNNPSDLYELTKLSVPRSGTPRSVASVLNLFENLVSTYSNIVGYSTGEAIARGSHPRSLSLPAQRTQRSPKEASIRICHHFLEVWDSDIPKNYGYNFLSVEPQTLPGINTMSGVEFEERAHAEIEKFFKEPEADVQIADSEVDLGVFSLKANRFTFFSPSSIKVGDTTPKITMGNKGFDIEQGKEVMAKAFAMNSSFKSPSRIPWFSAQPGEPPKLPDFDMFAMAQNVLTAPMQTSAPDGCQDSVVDSEMSSATRPEPKDEDKGYKKEMPDEKKQEKKKVSNNALGFALAKNAMESGKGLTGKGSRGRKYRKPDKKRTKGQKKEEIYKKSLATKSLKNKGGGLYKKVLEVEAGVKPPSRGWWSPLGVGAKGKPSSKSIAAKEAKATAGGWAKGGSRAEAKKATASGWSKGRSKAKALAKTAASFKKKNKKKSKRKIEEIQKQPPQIMSMAAPGSAVNNLEALTAGGLMDPNLSAESYATMVLNYRTLGELQYFVGFEIDYDNNNIFMNTPRFKTLDRAELIRTAGRTILCRIVRYEDKDLGIREPEGLTMPIYDRFFLLDVRESVGDLGEITAIETIADRVEMAVEVSAVVAAEVAEMVQNIVSAIEIQPPPGTQASGKPTYHEILETPASRAAAAQANAVRKARRSGPRIGGRRRGRGK